MNNKGFSLIELLGCLMILGIILGIGLYSARGTLGMMNDSMKQVSVNEIYDASSLYVIENSTKWINDGEEYACFNVLEHVDYGYFDYEEVERYKDKLIKIIRDSNTKVIDNISLVDGCE